MIAHTTLIGTGCDTTTALLLGGYLAILVALGVDYWRQQLRAWREEDESPLLRLMEPINPRMLDSILNLAEAHYFDLSNIRGGRVEYRAHLSLTQQALDEMGHMLDNT